MTFGPNNKALEKVSALLAAWRPGEEGGNAIVDILMGRVNPSGHLTQAWPANVGAVNSLVNPWFQEYGEGKSPSVDGGLAVDQPLFPFGYGLSFTTFSFGHPSISATVSSPSSTSMVAVTVPVENTGQRDGATVVQLYAEAPIARGIQRMQRTLVGFDRVQVKSSANTVAVIHMRVEDLARYDTRSRTWIVDPGEYTLYAQGCAGTAWDGFLAGSNQWNCAGGGGSAKVTFTVEDAEFVV